MLMPILLVCAVLPAQGPGDVPAVDWRTELQSGKKALSARQYPEAATRLRSALTLVEAVPGEDAGLLEAARAYAAVSRLQGRLEDAEKSQSRAVPAAARLHGDPSPELAAALSELASMQRSRGLRKEALATLQRAVRIRENLPNGKAEEMARDITGVALLQLALQDSKSAEETLRYALAAWETTVEPDNPRLLPVIDALGGIYRDNADYQNAESLYMRALMIRETALGPDSSELLLTLDSLAYVYFGQRKYSDAEPVYKRLLALWESSAGPEHPMVALTLDKMAEFYAFQQRYEEAEKAAAAALSIRANAHLASFNLTGRVLLMEAKIEQAEDLYKRAVEVGDLAKAADEVLDPLLRIYAKILRVLDHAAAAETIDRRVKEALIRKADREGRRPSPVKLPVVQ